MDGLEQNVVLVIDDSPDTVGMLNDILHEAGFTVLVALDGKQGLQIAKRMHPDIILLDAIMPNLNGFETCQLFKQEPILAHIPIIFMTGLSEVDHIELALESGGVDYISKPIQRKILIARLRVHIANARLTQNTRKALDSMGQYAFSANSNGEISWATPLAKSMLSVAATYPKWLTHDFPNQIKQWLSTDSYLTNNLVLESQNYPIRIHWVGQLEGKQYLLKIIDENQPDSINKIKQEFGITDREAEVLLWIAHGKTNREIGQILSMSPRTVNKHLEQIFKKLCVENRTSAAAKAIRCIVI